MEGEALIRQFSKEMQTEFGSNLRSIILCGSYVRGDNTENSDMDVYCFFECLTATDLLVVGDIVKKMPVLYKNFELNTQCMTVEEFQHQGFGRAFVAPIRYFESKVVYGEDLGTKPSRIDFIEFFQNVITDTVMSIRHYMTPLETAERLADGRLKRWVLKPLCVALRAERYIITGTYPRNYTELFEQSSGLPQAKAVKWLTDKNLLDADISNSSQNVLVTLLNIATEVSKRVSDLNTEEGG